MNWNDNLMNLINFSIYFVGSIICLSFLLLPVPNKKPRSNWTDNSFDEYYQHGSDDSYDDYCDFEE